LDSQLYSAPSIRSEIAGNGEITGHFTVEEAQKLAAVLQNPLRAPLKVEYSYDVDPTLGKDTIRKGISASIWSVVLVSLFMLIYYRVAGLTANIALITNIIILLGVMCSIGTTLTLPGIAGVVLTIGMAVDANVADLRAAARGTRQGQIVARRHCRRLRARVRHNFLIRTSRRSSRPSS